MPDAAQTGAAAPSVEGEALRLPVDNPVFTYCASFRARAARVQRALVLLGLALALLAGVTLAARSTGSSLPWWLAGGALAGVMLGLLWGYAWRAWLRASFRRRYGGDE